MISPLLPTINTISDIAAKISVTCLSFVYSTVNSSMYFFFRWRLSWADRRFAARFKRFFSSADRESVFAVPELDRLDVLFWLDRLPPEAE